MMKKYHSASISSMTTILAQLTSQNEKMAVALTNQSVQIAGLQSQVGVLLGHITTQTEPTEPPVKPTAKATSKASNPNPKRSYAAAAAKNKKDSTPWPQATKPKIPNPEDQDDYMTVIRKRREKKDKLIASKYPTSDREITISFDEHKITNPDQHQADLALVAVNQAMVDSKNVTQPPFIRSRFSNTGILTLTTGPHHCNMDYESYLHIITHPLHYIGNPTARIRERWSNSSSTAYPLPQPWPTSEPKSRRHTRTLRWARPHAGCPPNPDAPAKPYPLSSSP